MAYFKENGVYSGRFWCLLSGHYTDFRFKRTKNCYPSPVLHAISNSEDLHGGITLPISRAMSREKELQVMDEVDIHKKAQQLAARMLELKKQQRTLEKSIRGVERELSGIFDNAGIDVLDTEIGMLARRKTESGYEWAIEL